MEKNRLEAFSDGVLAIIITIMVLELHVPHETSIAALEPLLPVFLTYALSYIYVGIYWNNHHHLIKAARKVNGAMMWANLHLLFWLSLFPFVTGWMGGNRFTTTPTVLYGAVMLMAAIAYYILQQTVLASEGSNSKLAASIGRDLKGKISLVLYIMAIAVAFFEPWISGCIYVLVALLWLVPDRRIERVVHETKSDGEAWAHLDTVARRGLESPRKPRARKPALRSAHFPVCGSRRLSSRLFFSGTNSYPRTVSRCAHGTFRRLWVFDFIFSTSKIDGCERLRDKNGRSCFSCSYWPRLSWPRLTLMLFLRSPEMFQSRNVTPLPNCKSFPSQK